MGAPKTLPVTTRQIARVCNSPVYDVHPCKRYVLTLSGDIRGKRLAQGIGRSIDGNQGNELRYRSDFPPALSLRNKWLPVFVCRLRSFYSRRESQRTKAGSSIPVCIMIRRDPVRIVGPEMMGEDRIVTAGERAWSRRHITGLEPAGVCVCRVGYTVPPVPC